MSTSRTQTHTTSSSTAGPSGHRRLVLPVNPTDPADPDSFEEEDLEEDEAEVLRKAQEKAAAAAAAAAKQRAEEEAAKKPVDEDPDDGGDGGDDDDEEDERAPCERCRNKKLPCQMQAGKRSSIICKPCHDAKVRCSYSNRPFTVKREGGSNPTGERLAVLESQVAQLLADNRQLRDGQVKANTYH
ncbi:hypothetical protein F5876DRAFT_85109 [Lentinula aff. lateritia]|uniref:Uncharacterized protein n=1 Tax=Lentinula aff. lateritia TaxID=2804960 RepID=A0ACC1TFK7_9AGAR|nr:hypothetical protein F5876DRAFT_85109 [Lentinula aff. lateritia]